MPFQTFSAYLEPAKRARVSSGQDLQKPSLNPPESLTLQQNNSSAIPSSNHQTTSVQLRSNHVRFIFKPQYPKTKFNI